MISAYIILALILLCAALGLIIYAQAKGNKKTKQEAAALHEAFWDAARKAERLQAALGKQTEAEVKAHEERQDLAGTANGDLVHRANGLFGVPDKPGPSSAGNKS
jgi:alpha-D-ribose 1-methylphosphonate 5-triphosphate synthase subunit PhnG